MKALTLQILRKMCLSGFHFWVNVLAYKALLKKLFGIVLFYADVDWDNTFFILFF